MKGAPTVSQLRSSYRISRHPPPDSAPFSRHFHLDPAGRTIFSSLLTYKNKTAAIRTTARNAGGIIHFRYGRTIFKMMGTLSPKRAYFCVFVVHSKTLSMKGIR